MAVNTPDNATQVEDRIKADVQREAPDSNPYLRVHWLRSLIAGVARRIFDFYRDLSRTESRLMPDTADDTTAPRWGQILLGSPPTEASIATGKVVARGTAGSIIDANTILTANGIEYTITSGATISLQTIAVASITLSGATATATTVGEHNLSSFVPVTIAGSDQTEYNVLAAAIVVTGLQSFTFAVAGSPGSPSTGTVTCSFTSAILPIVSNGFGVATNLDADTPLALQGAISGVDSAFHASFGAIGGGTAEETTPAYKARYLDKIRNPVAHFNSTDIVAIAKTIAGVTRVFVERSGTEIGTISISSITRNGNVATVTTSTAHDFDSGQITTIAGADQAEYNVTNARLIVEDTSTFHFVIVGVPVTPATGTLTATTTIPLGQVRTFFMRDDDLDSPIPTASEVDVVRNKINTIRPANTSPFDNIVKAPEGIALNYVFTELVPDTATMRVAVEANIAQFHEEQTTVGVGVDEDAYRSAIKNTLDPNTGQIVQSFALSAPIGDIVIGSGQISIKGTVTIL
jgi:uncharacterized phage protein gp47/JayE